MKGILDLPHLKGMNHKGATYAFLSSRLYRLSLRSATSGDSEDAGTLINPAGVIPRFLMGCETFDFVDPTRAEQDRDHSDHRRHLESV
jgi:hypothetical protein